MRFLKRMLDLLGALIILCVLSPIMILVSLAIKLESRGPIFFVQERIGLGGRVFRMLKFRSMIEGAEQMGTGLFSYHDDNRITGVGHFIRRTSIDELPQIFNVIAGSMSLVGPRPPVIYELGSYADFTEHMKIRFEVKPGITGLAQISGRNDLDWDQKIIHDNRYVAMFCKWGILIDCVILLKTVWVVLRAKNTIEEQRG